MSCHFCVISEVIRVVHVRTCIEKNSIHCALLPVAVCCNYYEYVLEITP